MPLLSGVKQHSILSRLTNTERYPGHGCAWTELGSILGSACVHLLLPATVQWSRQSKFAVANLAAAHVVSIVTLPIVNFPARIPMRMSTRYSYTHTHTFDNFSKVGRSL